MNFIFRGLVTKFLALLVAYSTLLLGACTYEGPHQPVKNIATPEEDTKNGLKSPRSDGSGRVVFEQVKPIFQKFCVRCHSTAPPKIDWLNYKTAARFVKNGKLQAKAVEEMSMPKKGSPESKAISQKDRDLIAQWIADGALKDQPAVNPSIPGEDKKTSSSTVVDSGPLDLEQKAFLDFSEENGIDLDSLKKWTLINKCTACHGAMGMASGEIPSLAGLSKKYIASQLLAFKSNQRKDPNESMNSISKELSEEQTAYIANFFSRLKFVASDVELDDLKDLEKKDLEKLAKGKVLLEEGACLSCHGTSIAPKITGQNSDYLINQITSFQSKKRKNEMMNSVLENFPLDEESIENLALYLSRQVNVFPEGDEEAE